MIIVRDLFNLKFGKAREARLLWTKRTAIMKKIGYGPSRAMTDLVGPYYTFVMESTFEDLAAYESTMKRLFKNPEWRSWYKKFSLLVESGGREIYSAID